MHRHRPCCTEKDIFSFDMVTKLKKHFGSREPIWCTSNVTSLKREKIKPISFGIRLHQSNEHPQGSSNQSHRIVVFIVRKHKMSTTSVAGPNRLQSSPGKKFNHPPVSDVKFEDPSEYFHDVNEDISRKSVVLLLTEIKHS